MIIPVLLLLVLGLGWRGARVGVARAGLHLVIIGAAWPLALLLRPAFERLALAGAFGPLASQIGQWAAWAVAAALLDLLASGVRRARRRAGPPPPPAGWRRLDRVLGAALGVAEAVILGGLIARVGQIAGRVTAWPERYPRTVRVERPGPLRQMAALGRGQAAARLGALVGSIGGGVEEELDRIELLLQFAELPDGPEHWARRSPAFRAVLERPAVAELLADETASAQLEGGRTAELWADDRVRGLWTDPALWSQLAAALAELTGAPGPAPG